MHPCSLKWPSSKERWKILLIGDNEVGKTSFAYRFSDGEYGKHFPSNRNTLGLMFSLKEEGFGKLIFSGNHARELSLGENDNCEVSLSDTWVSQISYTRYDDEIPFNHGIILMYSITSRWSFQDVARTCRQVPLSTAHDPTLVLVLVGTKADEKAAREVSAEEGLALARDLGCQAFYETSAKTGQNVDATVFATVKALRKAAKERKMDLMSPIHLVRSWLKKI